VTPVRKAIGTNTEHSTSAIATIGPETSFIAWCAASSDVRPFLDIALDVLDHDNRVVNDDADRQHEAEQGQCIDREAEHIQHGEGADYPTPAPRSAE